MGLPSSLLRSDTQVVTGCDAESVNGLVLKQLRAAGVVVWDDVMEEMKRESLVLG